MATYQLSHTTLPCTYVTTACGYVFVHVVEQASQRLQWKKLTILLHEYTQSPTADTYDCKGYIGKFAGVPCQTNYRERPLTAEIFEANGLGC